MTIETKITCNQCKKEIFAAREYITLNLGRNFSKGHVNGLTCHFCDEYCGFSWFTQYMQPIAYADAYAGHIMEPKE
jgi:hypothetical protein